MSDGVSAAIDRPAASEAPGGFTLAVYPNRTPGDRNNRYRKKEGFIGRTSPHFTPLDVITVELPLEIYIKFFYRCSDNGLDF